MRPTSRRQDGLEANDTEFGRNIAHLADDLAFHRRGFPEVAEERSVAASIGRWVPADREAWDARAPRSSLDVALLRGSGA